MNRRSFFKQTVGALVAAVVAPRTITHTIEYAENTTPVPNSGQVIAEAWENFVSKQDAHVLGIKHFYNLACDNPRKLGIITAIE